MRFVRFILAPLLLAVGAGQALAGPASSIGASPLALQTIDYAPMVAAIVPAGSPSDPGTTFESRRRYDPYDRGSDEIRYRDRRYRSYSPVESPVQIHFGFFDPDGDGGSSFVVGLRGGPQVDPHIQIGAGIDWMHRTEDETVVAGDPYTQGGTTVTPTRVLSRASVNVLPMQLFLQIAGEPDMPVIPYGGISGGYQLLFLSADDFDTGESFDATFGGWGWQAWLGAGIPLSGQSRFVGEVFVNQAKPEREVEDVLTGITFRERVDADGVGMRAGFQFGF